MTNKIYTAGLMPNGIDSLIGADMHVKGDVASTGVLRVQGSVIGNVSCDCSPKGYLVVDKDGAITGTINTTQLAVRGRVIGPVQVSESIEIHPGAVVMGDVAFTNLAIHAGGIVEGMLTPMAAMDGHGYAEGQPARASLLSPPNGSSFAPGFSGTRKISVAITLISIIATAAWLGRDLLVMPGPADGVAPAAAVAVAVKDAAGATPVPAAESEQRRDPKAVDGDVAPLAASSSVGEKEAVPAPLPDPQETANGTVVTVKGVNPKRSASVVLLIGNQPAVLYKKMHDEPGAGVRISVAQGEKVTVSIAPDELVRVAEGRDVVVLYQGQKVARNTIGSGAWIRFVPR